MAKTILIVEDYEDTRGFMKILLESYGYQVVEAADGIEAVDRFKSVHPDLILMDISLPVVDGLTATKTIREIADGEQIPIIAVTAFGNRYLQRALEAGCDALIDKPVDFDALEPVLSQYLVHWKTLRETHIMEDKELKKKLAKVPDVDKNGEPIYKIDSDEQNDKPTGATQSKTDKNNRRSR